MTAMSQPYTLEKNGNYTAFDGRTMTYDEMDRLKTHTGPDGSWEYDYDLNGNRNWHKEDGVQTTYNYDATDVFLQSLTGGAAETRLYDDNGNTTDIGSRDFNYNQLNRFSQYVDGSLTVDYYHNAFGERQIKDDGSTETLFVYGGPNLLHEEDGNSERDYIYLNGEIVAMVTDGEVYYVHADHLGRPQVVTDGYTLKWDSENNAFGNNPDTDLIGGLNIGFPGQYYDVESGTYYNYFRTYDATTGRYLQSDPIGLLGGPNAYAYAAGNPIGFVDPFGLIRDPGRGNRMSGVRYANSPGLGGNTDQFACTELYAAEVEAQIMFEQNPFSGISLPLDAAQILIAAGANLDNYRVIIGRDGRASLIKRGPRGFPARDYLNSTSLSRSLYGLSSALKVAGTGALVLNGTMDIANGEDPARVAAWAAIDLSVLNYAGRFGNPGLAFSAGYIAVRAAYEAARNRSVMEQYDRDRSAGHDLRFPGPHP